MACGSEVVILYLLSSFIFIDALVKHKYFFYANTQLFTTRNLQHFNMKNLQNQKLSDDDNPSAPPFSDAGGEIKQEPSPASSRPNGMPSVAVGSETKTTTATLQNNIRQEMPKTSVRFVFSLENQY